jgi:hypothetical protein
MIPDDHETGQDGSWKGFGTRYVAFSLRNNFFIDVRSKVVETLKGT